MSTSKQSYALYRDNTLIASDLPYLAAIEKFAREDARREYAQERPACYVITGLSGFKLVGSHIKGRIRWEDQSPVNLRFGTSGTNRPSATARGVLQLSRGSTGPPSKPFAPAAPMQKSHEVQEAPGTPQPDPAQTTVGFTNSPGETKPPGS
jgi:hypothetical protein